MRGRVPGGTIVILLTAAWVPAAAAQQPLPRGRVVPRIVAQADSSESYALYLPTDYRPDRAWPLLIIMDPRGRALLPLEPLVPAAEQLGYVAVSSYNTMSDAPAEPTFAAAAAILDDVPARVNIDGRRVYFVGFSGTARMAWAMALQIPDHAAGVIGFGAGQPPGFAISVRLAGTEPRFAYFGGSGTLDFNFQELRDLEERLAGTPLPHRIVFYPGPHQWPPPVVMRAGVAWMELQAVRHGLRERPQGWIDSLLTERRRDADRLDARGETWEAWRAYRAVAEDFDGLADVSAVRDSVQQLSDRAAVKRVASALERTAKAQHDYEERFFPFLQRVRDGAHPSLDAALHDLQIADLQKKAADARDSVEALGYRRLLAIAYVHTSFYEPWRYIEAGDYQRALLMTRVAGTIHPNAPPVCAGLARIYAQLGRADSAFAALDCYVRSGVVTRSAIEADTLLAPLRGDPRYGAIVSRARDGTSPGNQ